MTKSIDRYNQSIEKRSIDLVDNPILKLIGNTSLIQINQHYIQNRNVKIYAKAEFMNPGGSIKDRTAAQIVRDAILNGELTKEKTLLDASSGNTGIAYAMIGASLGIKVEIVIPKNASKERINLLRTYGAIITMSDPMEGMDGAIGKAKSLHYHNPDNYYYADQYSNNSNWKAHYLTTGKEIVEQTNGKITHFIAGLGTTGTFTGTSRFLKEWKPSIKTYSFEPSSPFHGLEGLKHMGSSKVPTIYDKNIADGSFTVSTEESYEMVKNLALNDGLLVGISSGASIVASVKLSEEISEGLIVTTLPDRGDRYLTQNIWRNHSE